VAFFSLFLPHKPGSSQVRLPSATTHDSVGLVFSSFGRQNPRCGVSDVSLVGGGFEEGGVLLTACNKQTRLSSLEATIPVRFWTIETPLWNVDARLFRNDNQWFM
jgi:hypothetical protein